MTREKLTAALEDSRDTAGAVKEYLAEGEKRLAELHRARPGSGTQACRVCTSLIDDLLKSLFRVKSAELKCTEPMTMVAVGGYGRGELNVRSDIDLMLLYKDRITPAMEELTREMLYTLWDTGLDMGFSIRSVGECVQLALEDQKTLTSLIDMRLLDGDPELYRDLRQIVRDKLFSPSGTARFIKTKLEELDERHSKYGGSVYILEPNVKEGEGGLRDLHAAVWVTKAREWMDVEPFSLEFFPERERLELAEALDFLLWVRNDLHLRTSRKTDQLTFDHQERIARSLNYRSTGTSLAVEKFMQAYYRHAASIYRYSGLILSRCVHQEEERAFVWPRDEVKVDKNYFIVDGKSLRVTDGSVYLTEPEAMIKAFEYSQELDVELDQETRDAIHANLHMVDPDFRSSEEAARSFMNILRGRSAYKTLDEMHNLGFLESYIPEFGKIRCKVQHDRYHVYTVDTHTLFAIRELERLKGDYKSEFALLSTLFEELPKPEVLYLAVLFHDIGKALGKGHADKGAELVPLICKRLHVPEDDTKLISFLVRKHLLLADTAQYRDMHDEKLVVEFAKEVGEAERLHMLYLLTFADVRAVGPEVWSQWKGALFQELFFRALTVLERGSFEISDAEEKVKGIKAAVMDILAPEGIPNDTVEEYLGYLPQRYFLANAPEYIAGHVKLLAGLGASPATVKVRQDTFMEYTEIVIATHDIHGLFSMIAGVMTAGGVNILGAQIYTLKNGQVLDILQVKSSYGGYVDEESKIEKIKKDLDDVITERVKVDTLVGSRKPSILDSKPRPRVKTIVAVDNEVSDDYTVIDIHTANRIGLLYDITSTITKLGLYIYVSKISTKGDTASDIFYVKDIFGQKIYYDERIEEIEKTLMKAVSPESERGHGK